MGKHWKFVEETDLLEKIDNVITVDIYKTLDLQHLRWVLKKFQKEGISCH